VHVERDAETYIPPHLLKDQNILVEVGNMVHVSIPGGGGYEDPFLRNPELVLHDVKRGYYSEKRAQERFGIVLNPQKGVDTYAT